MKLDIEGQIAQSAIAELLAAGFAISVYDGEAFPLRDSYDSEAIYAAMRSTDTDVLVGKGAGLLANERVQVVFIWGNGSDVISDGSSNMDAYLKRTNALAERLAA